MCLYTDTNKPKIAEKDIYGYKIITKHITGLFTSYFAHRVIQFDKILSNDKSLQIDINTTNYPISSYEVKEGVFYSFITTDPILTCYYGHVLDSDRIYVCKAKIPAGSRYFKGFSNSFDFRNLTYGSELIEYSDPIRLREFVESFCGITLLESLY